MSDSKKRSTKVIVHCAKKTLTGKFPDMDTITTLNVLTKSGEVVYMDDGRTQGNEMIHRLAEEAGYDAYWTEHEEQDMGWAVIGGRIYCIREESERCSHSSWRVQHHDNHSLLVLGSESGIY